MLAFLTILLAQPQQRAGCAMREHQTHVALSRCCKRTIQVMAELSLWRGRSRPAQLARWPVAPAKQSTQIEAPCRELVPFTLNDGTTNMCSSTQPSRIMSDMTAFLCTVHVQACVQQCALPTTIESAAGGNTRENRHINHNTHMGVKPQPFENRSPEQGQVAKRARLLHGSVSLIRELLHQS